MEYRTETFSSDGLTITYTISGKGEPLVFLHGLGANPRTYADLTDQLSQEWTVYVPQIIPFGHSPFPQDDWDFRDYARYYESFLRQACGEPVNVLGHSLGGGIGLYIAATSTQIKRLVVMNPFGIPVPLSRTQIYYATVARTILWFFLGKPTIQASVVSHFLDSMLYHALQFHRMVRFINGLLRKHSIELERITIPVLILWGKYEELLPQSHLDYMATHIKNSRIIYCDGYHNFCFFLPEVIAQYASKFFRDEGQ